MCRRKAWTVSPFVARETKMSRMTLGMFKNLWRKICLFKESKLDMVGKHI
jgi:hypothetical protein